MNRQRSRRIAGRLEPTLIALLALCFIAHDARSEPVDQVSYIFVLAFPDTQDPKIWQKVMTDYTSAKTNVSFRIQVSSAETDQALTASIAKLDASGASYYLTAGSSDWGGAHLFWEPERICSRLQNAPHAKGLYLHEIMSARASIKQPFDDADLRHVVSFLECAEKAGKKVIWNEWAGSTWGWQTLLERASHGGLAAHVLGNYRKTLVLMWADNRDNRRSDQVADMHLAMREVRSTARQYTLQQGVSLQDWAWTESGGGTTPMPADIISRPGIEAYKAGARYFEFETYWGSVPNFLTGVSQLNDYVQQALNR